MSAVARRRTGAPLIAVAPDDAAPWVEDAVRAGGGEIVGPGEAEALVWASSTGADRLGSLIDRHSQNLAWVQLPWAGIEPFADLIDDRRQYTCGKGVYADPVAEHALALLLAGRRQLHTYARSSNWTAPAGDNLIGARVTVLGGGGITQALLPMLAPFRCQVTVVRRHPVGMEGADVVVGWERLAEACVNADCLVLALALTPETAGCVDRQLIDSLADDAWIVNVARGAHIVTDDLVAALAAGHLGGAALDVTDPEPLPDGHPLWDDPRCLITPHTANTPEMARPLLSARIRENVRRFAAGEALVGPVDPVLGY